MGNGDFKYSECFRSLTMYLIMWIVLHIGMFEYWPNSNVSAGLDNTSNWLLNYYNIFRNSIKYLFNGCFGKPTEYICGFEIFVYPSKFYNSIKSSNYEVFVSY